MIIHHHPSETIAQHTEQFIIHELQAYLARGKSLLLLSGGSAGKEVAPLLTQRFSTIKHLNNLTIGLVDERFGPPGHADSNMLVIKESGLAEIVERNRGTVMWPLQSDSMTKDTVVKAYNSQITRRFGSCNGRTLGVFGIGEDGHTAGIKPLPKETFNSIFTDSPALVTGYRAKDYERITLTPLGINQITMAVIFAIGEKKQAVLEKLVGPTKCNEHEFPAGIFRKHKNVHVFTDQLV